MEIFYSGILTTRAGTSDPRSGLMDKVEEWTSHNRKPRHAAAQNRPGARPGLPARLLCETLVINYHLDEISGGKLFPKDRAARDLQIDGVASLLMESLLYRSQENVARTARGHLLHREENGPRQPRLHAPKAWSTALATRCIWG